MNTHNRRDDTMKIVDDDDEKTFTVAELRTLKKIVNVYKAGTIIGGGLVFLSGITAAIFSCIDFFAGHIK